MPVVRAGEVGPPGLERKALLEPSLRYKGATEKTCKQGSGHCRELGGTSLSLLTHPSGHSRSPPRALPFFPEACLPEDSAGSLRGWPSPGKGLHGESLWSRAQDFPWGLPAASLPGHSTAHPCREPPEPRKQDRGQSLEERQWEQGKQGPAPVTRRVQGSAR